MYHECTQKFITAIERTARTFKARIKINGKWYSNGIKTATINYGSNSEDNITIGSAVSSYLDVTMKDIGELFENTEIELQEGVQLEDKTIEYIRMGYFTAQKPTDDSGIIKFTAYDRMTKAETVFSSNLTYPTTAAQILIEACSISGIALSASVNLDAIYINEKPEGYTCREIFGYIASLYGKFACIDRDGKLQLRWYEDSGYTVGVSRTWSFSKNQTNYVVGNLKCNIDKSTQLTKGEGARGITFDNPWMTDDRLSTLFPKLNTFTYRPGSVNFLGDIRLDVWDLITVKDLGGNEYKLPAMKLTQNYDGGIGTTVEAVGKTEEETNIDFKGPTTKGLERTYTELILVNKLVATKVDAQWVKANTVTTEELTAVNAEIATIKANMITTNYVEANFAKIDLANIASGSIKAAMIDTGAIGSAQIADGSITDAKIVALTASKITAGDLDCANINVTNMNCASLTVGQINGQQIAPGAIDMSNLADPVTGKINTATSNASKAIQDAATALTNANSAAGTATTAMAAANGKNTVIYSATKPSATGRISGDTWFDTANNNQIHFWYGSGWTPALLGTNAIADLAITNAKIGNLDAAKITTGYLSADRINARTITADKLAIGDFTNYVKDSSFETYTISSGVFYTSNEQSHIGKKSLKMDGGSSYASYTFYPGGIEVQAGDEFYAEFWAYRNDGNIDIKLNMSVAGYDGVWSWDSPSGAVAHATAVNKTWIHYAGVITVPRTGIAYPQFKECSSALQTGGWYFDDVIVRRRNKGELIVDGAITAEKIAVNSVDATKVVAGSINASCLAANSVTGDKIVANSISADKLTVGSGGNLYATGYDTFEQITYNTITYNHNSGSTVGISTAQHYYGNQSLYIVNNAYTSDGYVYLGTAANKYGQVPVVKGAIYRISCYAKSLTSTSVQIYACAGTTAVAAARATVGTTWTRIEFAYTATSEYMSIRVDNDTPSSTCYIDAIQIERVSNANQCASEFKPAGTTVINGGKIIANSITAAQIAANTITANQIATNSITATELSVSSLSAISANLGTVTAGIIKSTNYVANTTGMQLNLANGTWESKYLKIMENGRMICSNINIKGGILDIMPATSDTNVIRIGYGEWASCEGIIMQQYKMSIGSMTSHTEINKGCITVNGLLGKSKIDSGYISVSYDIKSESGDVITGSGASLNTLNSRYNDLNRRMANGRISFSWDDAGIMGYGVAVSIDGTYIGKIAMK